MERDFSKLIKNSEAFALDVSSWTDYIDRKRDIIANVIAGAPTLANLVPVLGAKANTTVEVPVLDTNVAWSSANCVASGTGASTTIVPRTADVKRLKDREELCLDELDAVLPMIQAAGAKNEELPFANLYINLKVAKNAKALEKAAWVSNVTAQTGNNAITSGYLAIADGETADLAYYSTFTGLTVANALTTLQTMIDNRSEAMFEMEDNVIYCSLPYFSIISQAIRAAGYYAGTGLYENNGQMNQLGINEMLFPGTNVRIKGTHGLNGNNSLFLTNEMNLRYVTDLESDKDNVDIFYDKYHNELVSEITFAMAFQYDFPENVVYLKKL